MKQAKILSQSFFLRPDVVALARELLGKVLVTNFDGMLTSGVITETEAYAGVSDKASHAFGGRKTNRTRVMYMEGGVAYVYLCYGIHSLFNVVTNRVGIPHAVLIRAIRPLEGLEYMLKRSRKKKVDKGFGVGPGKVSKIMGIHYADTAEPLVVNQSKPLKIWIEDRAIIVHETEIHNTSRIGVAYAGDDAALKYRFLIDS